MNVLWDSGPRIFRGSTTAPVFRWGCHTARPRTSSCFWCNGPTVTLRELLGCWEFWFTRLKLSFPSTGILSSLVGFQRVLEEVELGSLRLCFMVQVYVDGTTTMSTHERKASIREFYGKFLQRFGKRFRVCNVVFFYAPVSRNRNKAAKE